MSSALNSPASDHERVVWPRPRRPHIAFPALCPGRGNAAWPVSGQARTVCGTAEGHEHCQRFVADRDLPFEGLKVELMRSSHSGDSQAAREFYACLLGKAVRFRPHGAGKQSVFALVAAGFGVTLATESQAAVTRARRGIQPIAETERSLADRTGLASRAGGRGRRPLCRVLARRNPFTAPCLRPATAAAVWQKRDPSP